MFKNILLGIGGSAAIGGIGYGIYSSSQSYEKENTKDTENSPDPSVDENSQSNDVSPPEPPSKENQDKDALQPEGKKEEVDAGQKGDNNGATGGNSANISAGTKPQSEKSPAADVKQQENK